MHTWQTPVRSCSYLSITTTIYFSSTHKHPPPLIHSKQLPLTVSTVSFALLLNAFFSSIFMSSFFSNHCSIFHRNGCYCCTKSLGDYRFADGDERVVLAVQFFLLQGLTIIIFLTMPFLVILLHIASTFLMAVSCREPINILCPRESFFPTLLSFPPSVFVTLLASGQSHTN